jgi:hypothetical protein
MHHRLAVILILLILGACSNGTNTPQSGKKGCGQTKQSEEMAAEFRELRTVKGHFQGGAWNADVDAWMGRKHQIMVDLGAQLAAGGCSQENVLALLGAPDQIAREGDAVFDQVRSLPDFEEPPGGPNELLIYEWRGDHDFLYLVCRDTTVIGSGWWYAGD